MHEPISRKQFLRGAAVAAAAPAFLSAQSPNSEIRVGHIGVGTRGGSLVKEVVESEGAKVTAICDVYQPHIEKGVEYSLNPQAKRFVDYQEMLADPDIDAVVIATPDHWHSKMLIDAVEAGKDVYCEKAWTMTVAEAKAMRTAVKQTRRIMQLGHQGRQWAAAIQARDIIERGDIGPVALVRTGRAMNRPDETPIWRWYGWYTNYERPDPAQVIKDLDWERWLGSLPKEDFDMEHFWHWRCYWAYGTGLYGDLLSHELDYVQTVLRHGIPDTCISTGFNKPAKGRARGAGYVQHDLPMGAHRAHGDVLQRHELQLRPDARVPGQGRDARGQQDRPGRQRLQDRRRRRHGEIRERGHR